MDYKESLHGIKYVWRQGRKNACFGVQQAIYMGLFLPEVVVVQLVG